MNHRTLTVVGLIVIVGALLTFYTVSAMTPDDSEGLDQSYDCHVPSEYSCEGSDASCCQTQPQQQEPSCCGVP